MNFLRGQHVLILGLGDSGLAMARWARRCEAGAIDVADTREAPPQAPRLAGDVPGARLHCGAFTPALLDGVTLVLKSPGLSPLDAAVKPLLDAAGERGLLVLGELALFAHALKDLQAAHGYAPRVLAITGTNGKTTTTSMTAQLAERAGAHVAVAGNIGPTLLDTLAAALDLQAFEVTATAAVIQDAPVADPALTIEGGVSVPAVPEPASIDPADARSEDPEGGLAVEAGDVPDAAGAGDAQAAASGAAQAAPDDAADRPLMDDEAFEEVMDSAGGPPPHLIPPPPPPPRFEHLPDVWVLELSSFQLDGVNTFEPTAAAVLNITQDHLDWHGSMAAYAEAKQRVFGKHAVMVINRDDARVEAMTVPPAEPVVLTRFGKPKVVKAPKAPLRAVTRFGLDAPRRPGDFGLVVENGMAWLVRAHPADETQKRRKGEDEEILLQRLMPADALRVRGRHNAANALAALALATAAGLPLAPMLHGLREYAGEPHRVEYLRTFDGIEAYDDSKGTNVGATVAALTGLGADKDPARLVVILGGDGKGQDFSPLAQPVALYARAVALIGRDAPALRAALGDAVADVAPDALGDKPADTGVAAVPAARFDSLEAATRWCYTQARPGDAVLLSPACASLDMFRNYGHRAQVFIDTVNALAEERGELM